MFIIICLIQSFSIWFCFSFTVYQLIPITENQKLMPLQRVCGLTFSDVELARNSDPLWLIKARFQSGAPDLVTRQTRGARALSQSVHSVPLGKRGSTTTLGTILAAPNGKCSFFLYTELMPLAGNEKVLTLFTLLGVLHTKCRREMQKKHRSKMVWERVFDFYL